MPKMKFGWGYCLCGGAGCYSRQVNIYLFDNKKYSKSQKKPYFQKAPSVAMVFHPFFIIRLFLNDFQLLT